MLAKLELIGNLTADPVVKDVVVRGEKRQVTEFSVAVNDPFNKDKAPSFFNDIAAWNGVGQSIAKFCTKGSRVFVVADVEIGRSEKDGVKRQHLNATATTVRFLGGGAREESRYDNAPPSEVEQVETVSAAAPATATEVETAPAEAPAEPTQTELVAPF